MITELRRYVIKPDRLESWVDFFADAIAEHTRLGMRVEYAGVEMDTATFVWLRSFDDEDARVDQKDAFYGGEWWLEREAFAMDHVLAYDVTFLDAALVREGGTVSRVAWPAKGDRAGSLGDEPPDGWRLSSRAAWVREEAP